MKKIIPLLLLFPFALWAQGQPTINELSQQLGTSYTDFDLPKTIKTSKDFQQDQLSSESIDSKISEIITSQNHLPLSKVVTPINQKSLKYLGKIHPVKTNLFFEDRNYFVANDSAIGGDESYIYKYENLYIATISNTLLDRYLVYYTIRAYLIIKYRYPEIFKRLYEATKHLPFNYLSQNPTPSFINTTQNFLVTFDGKLILPSNNLYFGPMQVNYFGPANSIEVYPNTQIIYFNRSTVLNGGAAGAIPIYKTITNPDIKFHTYMLDGFIHSFIHERIHDWIFEYKNFNQQANYLRNKCVTDGTVRAYYPFEEAVVNNTTNILFEMLPQNGGLSDDILKFYRLEFDLSINKFKADGSYDGLKAELKKYNSILCPSPCLFQTSVSFNFSDDNKIFFLNLFKNEP